MGVFLLFAVQRAIQQQVSHADHCIHRGADLMAHVCQEIILRLSGSFGLFTALAEDGLSFLALADVDQHLGEHLEQPLLGLRIDVMTADRIKTHEAQTALVIDQRNRNEAANAFQAERLADSVIRRKLGNIENAIGFATAVSG